MRSGTLVFLAGILLFNQLPVLPEENLRYLLVACLGLVYFRPVRLLALMGVGFFWMHWHAAILLAQTLPVILEGADVIVEGEIISVPQRRDRRTRFEFDVKQLTHKNKDIPFAGRVRLSWYEDYPDLNAGDEWQFTVRMKRPHGLMNPGGFDYEKWLFQKHIIATGYVRSKSGYQLLNSDPYQQWINRYRQDLKHHINNVLKNNSFSGILQALAVGLRDDIPPEQWKVLTHTGTNHLMAISGLHIGLVAGLMFFVTRWLWSLPGFTVLWMPAQRVGSIAAMISAVIYATMAGFSIPTQRALIMLLVVLLSQWFYQRRQASQVLAWALLIILIYDPLSAMQAGFWLSFGAVTVIFYGMGRRISCLEQPGMNKWWWKWGRVQWLVAIGLMPIMLVLFGQISVYAPVANLVAVPWMSILVVPFTLLGAVLSKAFPFMSTLLLETAASLLSWLWWFLQWLSELPGVLWIQAMPPLWTVISGIVGIVFILAPRGIPARWLGIVWLLPLFLWKPLLPNEGEAWVTLLDIGQGLSTVVQTRHHALVFDTGPSRGSFDTGESVVIPFLRQSGIQRLDKLIVSHGDNDHAGGTGAILSMMPVGQVLSSEILNINVESETCYEGQGWNWDGVTFQILNPPRTKQFNGNNNSCVLKVAAGGKSILMTGDIGRVAEVKLIKAYGNDLKSDILVVPHHGSTTSSTRDFVNRVAPEFALFSVGYRNRYGFPKQKVVNRYHESGSQMLETADQGAISFKLSVNSPLVARSYRQSERRYWHGNALE